MGQTMSETNAEQITEEQAQAAFEAGFTGQAIDETPPANPEPSAEPAKSEESPVPTEPPAEKPAVLAGMTEDEVKALLVKASQFDDLKTELHRTRDQLNGKFGEINRNIQQLQQPAQRSQEQTPTGVPAGARFTADQFKRVAQEYGPEVAEAFAADLNEAMSVTPGQPVDIDAKLAPMLTTVEQTVEEKLLDMRRSDWRTVISTDDFALFKSQQLTPEERTEFDTSWSSAHIAGVIAKFDAWKDTLSKRTTKNQRLEQAVQPRGTQTDHTPSDADAFEAGFRAVRGT